MPQIQVAEGGPWPAIATCPLAPSVNRTASIIAILIGEVAMAG